MDSFSKRRPPKFTEPVDFNKINNLFEPGNDYSYSNQLLDRVTGLFSSDWNTSIDHGPFNFSADSPMNITPRNNLNNSTNHTIGTNNGSLYSSNLAHAINGIGSNPFNTKALNHFDYNNQWIAPRSCPPIGSRNSLAFNSFPANQPNNNNNINNNNINSNNNNNNNLNTINSSTVTNIATNNTSPANNFNNYSNNGQVIATPVNLHNASSPMVIGSNQAHHQNNNSAAAANTLNPLSASYVPPRVRRRNPTCTECVFCKNNGHPPSFYKGHILKDPLGRIVCPMLRSYSCPICCNGGGDRAHTVRYCPWNKPSFWHNPGGAKSSGKMNVTRFE